MLATARGSRSEIGAVVVDDPAPGSTIRSATGTVVTCLTTSGPRVMIAVASSWARETTCDGATSAEAFASGAAWVLADTSSLFVVLVTQAVRVVAVSSAAVCAEAFCRLGTLVASSSVACTFAGCNEMWSDVDTSGFCRWSCRASDAREDSDSHNACKAGVPRRSVRTAAVSADNERRDSPTRPVHEVAAVGASSETAGLSPGEWFSSTSSRNNA